MTSRLGNLFGLTACVLMGSAVYAQNADGWERSCNADLCTLTYPLRDTATDRRAATFLAVVTKDEATAQVGVAVPLGAALEAGVRLIAGDTVIDLPFEVCFPDGCRAMRRAGDATLDALSVPDQLDIRFFPFGNDSPISIIMPTEGLGDAIDEARAELSE